MVAAKIEISDVDGDTVTLRVQYGRNKSASMIVFAPPLFPDQPVAEAARQQVHELKDALSEWFEEGGEIRDPQRPS